MTCKNTHECDDDGCPGWGWFNDSEIQRCDTCQRFESDIHAYLHVLQCVDCWMALAMQLRHELGETEEAEQRARESAWEQEHAHRGNDPHKG